MSGFIHPELKQLPRSEDRRPVVAFVSDLERGGGRGVHAHDRAQLISVVTGSIAVTVAHGTYVVPSQRALWIPAGVAHETSHLASTQLRTLYVGEQIAPDLPRRCTFIHMSQLLRCLLDRLVGFPRHYPEGGPEERLLAVLLDQIAACEGAPLHLPMPRDEALRRIADAIVRGEGAGRRVCELAAAAGMSARTLERRFKAECAVTIREFRKQARLLRAVQLLAAGKSVNATSEELGYENSSAFIAMFRAATGSTPGTYLKARPGS